MTWRPARTRCMRGTSAPPRSCGKSRSPPRERRGSTSSSTRAASAGCPTRTSTAKTIPRMPATSVIRVPRLGLGAKIFVAATVSVAAVLGVTLGLTSLQANRTADAAIRRALAGVRRGVQAFLSGRTATFAGMSAVSAQVPQFRERLLRGSERGNVLDQAEEYRQLLGAAWVLVRSEEHTSELQSRLHLVCRLLLEKKKNTAPCTARPKVDRLMHPQPLGVLPGRVRGHHPRPRTGQER